MQGAVAEMRARSKAKTGDKTILDAIGSVAAATQMCGDAQAWSENARQAVAETIAQFRERPAVIGRLRLAPNQGLGHDDPGMVAFQVALEAMSGAES
jgi:dihydroxyacetone kinase-like protein